MVCVNFVACRLTCVTPEVHSSGNCLNRPKFCKFVSIIFDNFASCK